MKNIAHLRGLAKKVCSRQQLICPFVDNATIHASVDLMNSLTTQTVSGQRFSVQNFRPNFFVDILSCVKLLLKFFRPTFFRRYSFVWKFFFGNFSVDKVFVERFNHRQILMKNLPSIYLSNFYIKIFPSKIFPSIFFRRYFFV